MGILETNAIPNFGHIIRKETVEYVRTGKMNGKRCRGRWRMKEIGLNGIVATRGKSKRHDSKDWMEGV